MTTPSAFPVVVIGGYLGAGKTTLVNHLLRHADDRRIAVLVNDFGRISIDASLIEGQGEDGVLAIAGGCMCCAYGDDLVGALAAVVRRDPPVQAILIECSGVGIPGAVARAAALVPGVQIDGVVVVVDASDIPRLVADGYVGDTVQQQLKDADLLIVNHADRVVDSAWPGVDSVLQTWAPGCPTVRCEQARTSPELVWGWADATLPQRAAVSRPGPVDWRRPTWSAPRVSAASRFRYVEAHVDRPVDAPRWIEAFVGEHAGLLRAKGWVLGVDGQPWLVQAMGQRCTARPDPANRRALHQTVVGIFNR